MFSKNLVLVEKHISDIMCENLGRPALPLPTPMYISSNQVKSNKTE